MSKSTGYITGIAVTIAVGAILQYFLCCAPGSTAENTNDLFNTMPIAGMPFSLKDPNSDFTIQVKHNFDFPFSSYTYIKPLNALLEEGIGELKNFLDTANKATLSITGFSYQSEENLSAFPTLGEARANAVKSALIDREIGGDQLIVSGTNLDGELPEGDTIVKGPITYSILRAGEKVFGGGEVVDSVVMGDGVPGVAEKLQNDPLVLYFETGRAYVALSQDERQIISSVNQYIDQNPDARIEITGHTDNSGSPETNQRLGRERAEFLKSYLVRNGFQSNRIDVESKGELDPIASNGTSTGKAKNRRAVMVIKN